MSEQPLRIGILGAARIALGTIVPAAAGTEAVEVTAVATRDGEKAPAVKAAAPDAAIFEDYEKPSHK